MKTTPTITYHKSISYIAKDGIKHSIATQLYPTGIYYILDYEPAIQGSISPKQMVKIQTNIKKDYEKGNIRELKLGPIIHVEEVDNMYKEIKN